MASSEQTDSPVFQEFKAEDGSPLTSLRTHLCAETGERFILWTDIQREIQGAVYLRTDVKWMVLFTIDTDGELHYPLRIPYYEGVYIVIHRTIQKDQTEDFHDGHEDSQGPPFEEILPSLQQMFDACQHLYRRLECNADDKREFFQETLANTRYHHSMLVEEVERQDGAGVKVLVDDKDRGLLSWLRKLFVAPLSIMMWTWAFLILAGRNRRDTDIEGSASSEARSRTATLSRLNPENCPPLKLLEELHDLQQKVPDWDYRNICHNTLHENYFRREYSTLSLFFTLPYDLDSWDGTDPSTRQFRLYFLCDNWKGKGTNEELPQHVHLSNHPGYNLKKPEEFFQKYGDYILRVLQMIKHGYSGRFYEIPPLDATNILWNCDPNIVGSHLTMDIETLVDRAISYFLELSPPKWKKLGLTCDLMSAAIKTYLDVQDGDNAEGNLHRFYDRDKYVHWKCDVHAQEHLSSQSLERLKEFVHSHGGHIDMQQATVRVELRSMDEVDQFLSHFHDIRHIFDISIKLGWNATWSEVKRLCLDIGEIETTVLELDGITLEMHPQGYDQHMSNLFLRDVMGKTGIRVIALQNYPRPQEQCVHVYQYSLQFENPPSQSSHGWLELKTDLNGLHEVMSGAQDPSEWNSAAMLLQSTLRKPGISGAHTVTFYSNEWKAVFDRESGAVVEVHSEDLNCPKGVLSEGSIQTLRVHLNSLDVDQELFNTVRANTKLQDFIVSYYGHNIMYYTEHIVGMWHSSSTPFRLTLLDRMKDTRGRIVAQLASGTSDRNSLSGGTFDPHGCDTNPSFYHLQQLQQQQQQQSDVLMDIVFTQWDCDHVFSKISDYSASFLDMASQQHPSVLIRFTLDVSCLSRCGLSSVREVLRRSDLEHLHIVCNPIDSQSESIAQVLGAVQWTTIKSLVLSGNNIEEWIDLFQFPFSPGLLSLQIQGTWPSIQELSHSSVLFIHNLVCSSQLADLHFRNVQLQDRRDWTLILDSIDFSLLRILDLGIACTDQLVSTPEAANLFISRMDQVRAEAEGTKLVMKVFSLTSRASSQLDLDLVQKILSMCKIEKLHIDCATFDPRLSSSIAQVLSSVHWTSLECLILTGDNIKAWIQLLPKIETPRLKSLSIQGSERVEHTLAHSSVLFAEQLIRASPLEELSFYYVRLQDSHDWVRLVESMDPSLLEDLHLGFGSYEQFVSTTEAVETYDSKFKPK
ncbi:hypothetical protein MVEG_10425 [Podila verticillata NRRL 6337]|nr:hypothetical protein MVEG_10425 [Podila verticillata NRRL 6337]